MSVPGQKKVVFPDEISIIHMNSRTNDQIAKNDNSLILKQQEEPNKRKKSKKRKKKKKEESNPKDEIVLEPKKKRSNSKNKSNLIKSNNIEENIAKNSGTRNENPETNVILSRCKRQIIFIFIVLINICINLDHGTLPAATEVLMKTLDIREPELGTLGTLLYAGNAIGSIITMLVIDKFNRKYLLFIALLMNGVGMLTFTVTKMIGFLYFNRIFLGIFQAFCTVYCPVWVDQYGPRNKKTMMMALMMVGTPLGVVLGYAMTMVIILADIRWELSFYIQCAIFAIFSLLILFMPNIYFSTSLKCINPPDIFAVDTNKKEEKKNDSKKINEAKQVPKKVEEDVMSIFQHKIEVYTISVCGISVLLFISTAIQFWTSSYLIKVVKIEQKVVFVAFVISCVTAPTLGILVGGYIVHKCGGYEGRKSLFICSIYGLCAVLTGIPIVFCNDIWSFAIFLWLFLFFGGTIVPNLMGIILSSLPHKMRAAGNSVTLFITTVLGFLPAPVVYGVIYDLTHKSKPKLAYGIIINYSIASLILILIGTFIREREFRKKIEQNKSSKSSLEIDDKIKPNRSENENLKENSEVKNESSDNCLNNNTNNNNLAKESFKIVDDDVIKFKKVKRGRNRKKSEKVIEEVIMKKDFTEKNIMGKGEIIYKGENGNEEVFEIKVRNAEKNRENQEINHKKKKRPQIGGETKKV